METRNMVMRSVLAAAFAGGLLVYSVPVYSAELIYQPVIPAFGGSPLYEDYLVGLAQLQNQHLPSSGGGGGGGGGTPNISFPDINIDLGGIGGGGGAATPPPVIIIPTPSTGTNP